MEKNGFLRYINHQFSLRQSLGWIGVTLLIILLGAHFFRAFQYGLMVCCIVVLLLHCGHAQWKRYAVSFFLLWGAFEWGTTAFFLAQSRMQAGLPWFRAALILWGVACMTCLGAIALYNKHRDCEEKEPHAKLKGIVFISVFCAIYYLAHVSPVPLLLLERFIPRWGDAQIVIIAWYSVFVVALLLDPKRSRKGRKFAWLAFALLFFGQLAFGLLGAEKMLMTGDLHIPVPGFIVFGPVFRGVLSMMVVLVLVATLLTGSAWCSMLCYFGPFDSFIAGNKAVKPIPSTLQWMMRYGRLCILALGVLVAIAFRLMEQSIETALVASFLFVAASFFCMMLISRKYNSMMHCTAFCPMGIVINTLGKISPWRMRIEADKCDHCGACEKICKYRAITYEYREKGQTGFQCSLCMDCTSACKNKAIAMHTMLLPFSSTTAKHIFVVLLVTLHATFIAFARV